MQINIIFLLVTIIISSHFLIKDILEIKESEESNIKLIEQVITEENNVKKINWEELEKLNKDIIGWIKIENTNINYPILKDNENLKYLKHSFNGKYNNNGSIFTLNSNPFQENETIIYGHNMRNGMMFSQLGKYMEKEFLDKNSTFEIYTKNQN